MTKYKQKFIFYFTFALIIYVAYSPLHTQVQAQEGDRKPYIGVAAIIGGVLSSSIAEQAPDEQDVSEDSYNSGRLLTFGYQFNRVLGGEIAHGKTIDADISEDGGKLRSEALEISLLLRVPQPIISPFLRVGWSEVDLTASRGEQILSEANDAFLMGGGVDFFLVKNLGIRLEISVAEYDFFHYKIEAERGQLGMIIRY